MMTRLSHKRNVGRKWATNSVERIHITLNVYKTRNWLLPLSKKETVKQEQEFPAPHL